MRSRVSERGSSIESYSDDKVSLAWRILFAMVWAYRLHYHGDSRVAVRVNLLAGG